MIEQWPQVVASGMAVVWILLWIAATYSERGSDRQTFKMGFYLSVTALGLWAVLTLAILGIGWLVWGLLG